MRVIKLKTLTLKNFKGMKNLNVNFEDITNICGDNKLGKSTIFDGFTWLLFDKDSQDRSRFEVQPLDQFNNVIHMLETEVSGILEVDGKPMELKKILRERWIKKRGEVSSEYKGTETLYYINEVPLKQSEYKDKISSIIDEQLFKLVSNPLFFSMNMKWQDRRQVIIDIVGDVPFEKVINSNKEISPLIDLIKDSNIDDFKKTRAIRKKKLLEEKKSIPYRVDELHRTINFELDFDALEFRKGSVLAGINNIAEQLSDSTKANEELLKEKDRLVYLKSRCMDMENKTTEEERRYLEELNVELRKINKEIFTMEKSKYRLESIISSGEDKILELEEELQNLRDEWIESDKKELVISENEFICPTCKRAFEEADIEVKKKKLFENFKINKFNKLKEINNTGKTKKHQLEKITEEIKGLQCNLQEVCQKMLPLNSEKLQIEHKMQNLNLKEDLSHNPEYKKMCIEINELENKVNAHNAESKETIELKAKKGELEKELEEINVSLSFKEQNIKTKARITELMEEEKSLAEKIAELEGQEYLCQQYMKTKVKMLEWEISSKFKFVKFKLLNNLVNGAVEECCEALIDGVPFNGANTASQINAGLDIINALSEYYKISAPIFIDNRESINEILQCNSQIINLIVSKDKQLIIKGSEREVA